MEIAHESYVLDNGLEVVFIQDPSLPKVVVDLWYDVGSFDDPPHRSGFAHLFEHLMFKGTPRIGEGKFDQTMEAAGGWNNASTGDERTNYYDVGPKNTLDLLLWLEADRMTGLDITQKKLDVEREVVRNERRQNYEDSPYGSVWIELPKAMYPENNPLSRSGIGNHEDLMASSVEDVRAFYNTWYVPNNCVLAVAGDFDPAAAKRWIAETFGALPRKELSEVPKRVVPPMPDVPTTAFVEIQDDVALPAVLMTWHTPALYAPGDAELDLLAAVLAGSDDSRLVKRLVYTDQSAQEVSAAQYSGRWGSLFVVQAYAAPGHSLEELEKAIDEEFSALMGARPMSDDELLRARNNRELDKLYSAESLMGRAELLQSYRMHVGRYDYFTEDLARYRTADAASVARELAKLTPARRGRIHVLPQGEE